MTMDEYSEDDGPHHRRSKRSLVLLAAKVRTSSGLVDARLRNLSQNGALLETETPPAVGAEVVFERGETIVKARVAWTADARFGLEFLEPIEESEVLVHVGRARPSSEAAKKSFRRTGLREQPITREQRSIGEAWVNAGGRALGD